MKKKIEETIHVGQWLTRRKIRFCYVTDPASSDEKEASRLMGVHEGAPTLLIFSVPAGARMLVKDLFRGEQRGHSRRVARGYAIIMKRLGKWAAPKPAEMAWVTALVVEGWNATVCHGAAQAIDQLDEWGFGHESGDRTA